MLDLDIKYAALHAELRKPNIGTALCWRVVRLDGSEFFFTDHDRLITESETAGGSPELTFTPVNSFSGLARKQTEGLSVDNITLFGLIDGGSPTIGISEADVLAEIWSDASVTIWLAVWTADTSVGLLPLNEGTIGPMTFRTHSFEAELRGIAERLQRATHRTYQLTCDAVLGDTRCGVSLDGSPSFRSTVNVAATADDRSFSVDFTGQTANWFQYGTIEFLTGNNAGLKREIISHTLNADSPVTENLILLISMPFEVTAGDSVRLTAGCDKRATTCAIKFSNKDRFRGFDMIPTQETILETPNAKT